MATTRNKTFPNGQSAVKNARDTEGMRGAERPVQSGSASGEKLLRQLDRFAAASREGKRR
jgi:hypothetical protein